MKEWIIRGGCFVGGALTEFIVDRLIFGRRGEETKTKKSKAKKEDDDTTEQSSEKREN